MPTTTNYVDLKGGNIVNVELVCVIVTDSSSNQTKYYFKTSSQVTFTPAISAGQEKEQRIKNRLMGLIKTSDLVKGYDIELSDQRLLMDIFAIINGGTMTGDPGDQWTAFVTPTVGSEPNPTAFDLEVYTSDRDTDGNATAYYQWSFTNCKGKPVTVGAQDDDFYTLKYTIESRPAANQPGLGINKLNALPNPTPSNSGSSSGSGT